MIDDDRPPLLATGLTWEKMQGLCFRTAARTIIEADLATFLGLGGFTEPLFRDAEHAKTAGYRGTLLPGGMVYMLAEGLVLQTNVLHGTGIAFLHMEFDVKAPTYVGDTLHVIVTTMSARASSKPGRGVVTSRCSIRNQRNEEVAVYTPVRLIRGADHTGPEASDE